MASKPSTKLSILVQTLMAYLLYTLLATGYCKKKRWKQLKNVKYQDMMKQLKNRHI